MPRKKKTELRILVEGPRHKMKDQLNLYGAEVFGSLPKFNKWYYTSLEIYEGKRPCDFTIQECWDMLGRIAHGYPI